VLQIFYWVTRNNKRLKTMKDLLKTIKAIKKKRFPSAKDKQEKLEQLEKRTDFYKIFIGNGDICFDVGANVGNRVEPLLKAGGKVIAVEPQKNCYEILKKKFGNTIDIVTEGLSSEEGEKTFYISSASTISSFSKDWIDSVKDGRFKNESWTKTETVKMTTLDVLIKKYGTPSFIKIDVEGYELEVLNGLSAPVKCISIEYTVPEQTQKTLDCIDRIQKVNGETEFNYSIGESMELALDEWISYGEMVTHIKSQEFIDTGFGDIYARKI